MNLTWHLHLDCLHTKTVKRPLEAGQIRPGHHALCLVCTAEHGRPIHRLVSDIDLTGAVAS